MPKNTQQNCFDDAIYKAINCTANPITIGSPSNTQGNHSTKIITPKLNKS